MGYKCEMIKAVIFDMDGTITDTEKYYYEAWQQAFHEFGVKEFGPEDALSLRSFDARLAARQIKEKFGEHVDYFEIRERRRALIEERIAEEGIDLKPGLFEIIEYLRGKKLKCAIATATALDVTIRRLKSLGIYEYFDEIISAKTVEVGKPYPDVYLYACECLKVAPAQCIAVEDSPNGVMSASRAGCKTVFVPDLTGPTEELEPYLFDVCASLADLKRPIENCLQEEQ